MRIAVVLNTSWNIYNFRMGLIKRLQEFGAEVHTIAPKDAYSDKLIAKGCQFHEVKMDSRGANPIKDFALIYELKGIYKRIQPDVILHFTIKPNIYGTLAAKMLGIPVINNVCGLGTVFLDKNLISKVALALYKLAFRYPRKVFFQNADDRDLFVEKGILQASSTDLVPGSGIDVDKFCPEEISDEQREFTFLVVSRLIHDKGILEYIEAVKMLRSMGINAKFQILGAKDPEHKRGISLNLIDDWIDNDVIEYLGTTDDVRSVINKADCVVLPSYREGTPRTLLEAACLQKPIVTTNVPGCNHVVEDNYNGFLCEIKNPHDLAEKMKKMFVLDTDKRKQLGVNGRNKILRLFDEKLVIEKYLKTIKEILPTV